MVSLLRLSITLVFSSGSLLLGCASESSEPPAKTLSEKLAPVDAFMQSSVDTKAVPGGVLHVERLDAPEAHTKAFGLMDIENGRPYTPDAMLRIASMTKAITSAAVMILVDEKKISLDDPLGKYLPEWQAPTVLGRPDESAPLGYVTLPAKKPLTVRSLLTHTAGISYRFMGPPLGPIYAQEGITDGFQHTELTLEEQSKKLAALPLLHEPGDDYDYGLNTDVLGRLIEVVSGMPLDAFFAARILEPLGMKSTYFYPPEEELDRIPVLYRHTAAGELELVPADGKTNITQPDGGAIYAADFQMKGAKKYLSGGAGLVSTAADYATFLRMVAMGGELGGERILSEESVALMTTNQIGELRCDFSDAGFGLGFAVNDDPARAAELGSVGTFFWAGIFKTVDWVDPDQKIIGLCLSQLWDLPNTSMDDCRKQVIAALSE